jgi:hypothetical protein
MRLTIKQKKQLKYAELRADIHGNTTTKGALENTMDAKKFDQIDAKLRAMQKRADNKDLRNTVSCSVEVTRISETVIRRRKR